MSIDCRNAAVFLDRDGTLIRDVGYLCREEQLEILPRVPEAIRRLRDGGFKIVVITNQSAVARGRLFEADLLKINQILRERLARDGALLDGIYYCPHHPTEGTGLYTMECDCRKPKTGLIRRAAADLQLDASVSYVVGDQAVDMELAQRAGAAAILLCGKQNSQAEAVRNAHCVADLWQAAQWILDKSDSQNRRGVPG